MTFKAKRTGISASEWGVILFTIAYMAVSLVASLALQNKEFVFYFAVMGILMGGVVWIHWQVRFHPAALWGLSLWGLAHMSGGLLPIPNSWPRGGETPVLYNLWLIPGWLKYDQLVHAYGFGLVTWICWQCLQAAFARRGVAVSPTLGLLTLCVAAGIGFGAANEVVEFIATLTLPGTNVGGYQNTGWDLIANLTGALLAAVAVACWPKNTGE